MKRFLLNPFVIMLVAVQVILFLMLKVVPTFNEVFSSFGARLPWSTQICVNVGNIILNHRWLEFITLAMFFPMFELDDVVKAK